MQPHEYLAPTPDQIHIAMKMLRYSDMAVATMGSLSKKEARRVLKLAGWTDEQIADYELK